MGGVGDRAEAGVGGKRGRRGGHRVVLVCWWVETLCVVVAGSLSLLSHLLHTPRRRSFLLDWTSWRCDGPPGVETTVLVLRLLLGGLQDLRGGAGDWEHGCRHSSRDTQPSKENSEQTGEGSTRPVHQNYRGQGDKVWLIEVRFFPTTVPILLQISIIY